MEKISERDSITGGLHVDHIITARHTVKQIFIGVYATLKVIENFVYTIPNLTPLSD